MGTTGEHLPLKRAAVRAENLSSIGTPGKPYKTSDNSLKKKSDERGFTNATRTELLNK